MRFKFRTLDYAPTVGANETVTLAIVLLARNEKTLRAVVRQNLDSLTKRFPNADVEYLEALLEELSDLADKPSALHEYLQANFSEASFAVTMSHAKPLEERSPSAATKRIRAMLP